MKLVHGLKCSLGMHSWLDWVSANGVCDLPVNNDVTFKASICRHCGHVQCYMVIDEGFSTEGYMGVDWEVTRSLNDLVQNIKLQQPESKTLSVGAIKEKGDHIACDIVEKALSDQMGLDHE